MPFTDKAVELQVALSGIEAEVGPICEQIARDIRNQYTIAHVPTDRKRDGTYRTIQVKASAPGHGRLLVRTRTGYCAPQQVQALPAKATDQVRGASAQGLAKLLPPLER
jgi:hypothetical protein